MNLREVEEITGGKLVGQPASFAAVSIDTRTLTGPALFIAIEGVNFDGHEFVQAAADKGAVGAVVRRRVESALPQVIVEDTRRALGLLGAFNRSQSRARVLALTGSQGKTTVKEMAAAMLERRFRVLVTRGNLNNDLGVPLTLLNIAREHDCAVIEMGANAPGEIAYTGGMVRPDIAHITNAAATHLEGFGSLEGVARAKGEMWQALRDSGTGVLNLDDVFASLWRQMLAERRVVGISAQGKAEAVYRLSALRLDPLRGSAFTLHSPAGAVELNTMLLGAHNAANALAAAAMAMEAGATLEDVREGLAGMRPVPGRLNLKKGMHGATVIDDSYNASPSSFRAAIDVLTAFPGETLVAAGDMGELGSGEAAAHEELGAYARAKGVKRLFCAGKLSAHTARGFGADAVHCERRDELAARIIPCLRPGVAVLVKGSRSARMELLAEQLTEKED